MYTWIVLQQDFLVRSCGFCGFKYFASCPSMREHLGYLMGMCEDFYKDADPIPQLSLYDNLKIHGINTDHHESDLYFPLTVQTTAILEQYPVHSHNATIFTHVEYGFPWYDVPFAFTPWWENKQRRLIL
jgi:hypothetical protein